MFRGKIVPTVHPRYAPVLFSGLLSAIMVSVISGIMLLFNYGLTTGFCALWGKSFLTTWPIAFPTVLVVAPLVRRVVGWLTTRHETAD